MFTTCVFLSHSQSTGYVDYHIEHDENSPMAETGTYQIMILSKKKQPVFTSEILYFIESKRKDDVDCLIHLSEYADVFIPSRKTINKEGFIPLEEITH